MSHLLYLSLISIFPSSLVFHMLSNGIFFLSRLIQNEPTFRGLFDGTVWSTPQVLNKLSESGPFRR